MNCNSNFLEILTNCYPDAYADICGGNDYPNICGRAYFYQFSVCGTLVKAEVGNLPLPSDCYFSAFYGIHIHENGNCTPPFDKTGEHFNPGSMPHPMHVVSFKDSCHKNKINKTENKKRIYQQKNDEQYFVIFVSIATIA